MSISNKLQGKRILFFSVKTFNLEKSIVEKLEELGAFVDYFDERPNNNNFTKAIIRIKRSIYQKKIDLYYRSIWDRIKNKKYDYLFVNRGEVVPDFFLKKFVKKYPDCKNIYYNWDSFKNNSHPIKNLKYFNLKYSFDPEDCKKYNLKLRPLFFLDAFSKIESKKHFKNDLLFVGTTHSDRYSLSMKIKEACLNQNLKMHTFFYIQGFFVFYYKRLFDSSFEKGKIKDMSFKGLSTEEIILLYENSKIVLDINHPDQRGLTMRTFESIGAKRKLITTNSDIKNYSFFNEKNILIIDRNNFKIDFDFFEKDYEPVKEQYYSKLSLEGWIYSLFFDNDLEDYWYK